MTRHEDLVAQLQGLRVADDSLPFCPARSTRYKHLQLSPIPRFLFRAFSRQSRGSTGANTALSRDAAAQRPHAAEDIFQTRDVRSTAMIIAGHLNNDPCPKTDNLVSWTSSLLFAVQYMLYRHHASRDGSSLKDIKLCVIDTSKFPPGTFIRDMDLIDAFCAGNAPLKRLQNLRTGASRAEGPSRTDGTYYFGEYLSQGHLNIRDRCNIVSAHDMLDAGLASLWPQFSPRDQGNLEWTEKVRRIRKELSNSENSPYDIDRSDAEQADTALRIAALFGPDWRLPMTIHFLALLKGALHATNIKAILTRNGFQDEDLIERLQMNVIPYNGMPELRRLETIVRFIHAHEQDEWSV